MKAEAFKFTLNGLFSTFVHYSFLFINIELLGISNIIISNLIAGVLATVYSFIGNRSFVFKRYNEKIHIQFYNFIVLYAILILLHTICMYIMVDMLFVKYQVSFIIVAPIIAILSFVVNNLIVFKK